MCRFRLPPRDLIYHQLIVHVLVIISSLFIPKMKSMWFFILRAVAFWQGFIRLTSEAPTWWWGYINKPALNCESSPMTRVNLIAAISYKKKVRGVLNEANWEYTGTDGREIIIHYLTAEICTECLPIYVDHTHSERSPSITLIRQLYVSFCGCEDSHEANEEIPSSFGGHVSIRR